MKRFLSIILALALVLSLAPMTFAAEGEKLHNDGEPVVYNFTKAAVEDNSPEYSGYWKMQASYVLDDMCVHYIASSRVGEASNGIVYKISVSESGLYVPTIYYVANQYGGVFDAYIMPASEADKNGWDMTAKTNDSNGTDKAFSDYRTSGTPVLKKFIAAVDSFDGKNTNGHNVYNSEFVRPVTCEEPIELKKGDYYILFSISAKNDEALTVGNYNGSVLQLSKLSLQKVYSKTQKFVIGTSVLSDETIAAATSAGHYRSGGLITGSRDNNNAETGIYYYDDYSEIDESKGSGDWKYSYLGGATIYLYPTYATLYVAKVRYGNSGASAGGGSTPYLDSRYVFEIDVKHQGTYDITADTYDLPYGTEADVYIVKKSEVDASSLLNYDSKGECNRMTMAYLKSIPIDGRIGNIGEESKVAKTEYVCTKTLDAAEYYVILHLNSDNPVASSGKHLLNFGGITLAESDGSIIPSETPSSVRSKVSFGTNIDGAIATKTVNRGESVELSAPETNNAGEVFKCWVRGTEENGTWISSKANDTYKVMTNTYLTAVYEAAAETEGKVVEFYNENGEYYATVAAVDGKAVLPENNPTLAGYDFAGWYTSEEDVLEAGAELASDITYAVAKYTAKKTIGADSNDVVRVNGTNSANVNFGEVVSGSDSKATYWLRNGEIVKFGTAYDYYIWDAANIMSSYDTTTAVRPTVVIDTTSIDGAYMIEYDKGNKAIAEVGILFGSSAKMTVDSCSYKATSQWNRDHGQFMASPYGDTSEKFARGYLIYADGDDYKVIYTDAIELQ